MIPTTKLELSKTAIVVIDLQEDILAAKPLFPISAQEVITRNTALIHTFKDTDVLTVLVTVDRTTFQGLFPFPDGTMHPSESPRSVLTIPTLGDQANVIQITKHNPGAFFGTDLDLQLRRRGIQTIILTGVSTSNGVYATALDAYQSAYHVLIVEDACADRDLENHQFFFRKLFPRIGQVTTQKELAEMLTK